MGHHLVGISQLKSNWCVCSCPYSGTLFVATKLRCQSLVSTIFEGLEFYVTHDNGERSKKKYGWETCWRVDYSQYLRLLTAHYRYIQRYMEYAGSSNYWSDIPIIPIKWLITYDRICQGIYHKGFFIVKMGIYSLSIIFFLSSGFVIPSSSRIGVSLSVPRLKDFQDQDSGIDGNKD